MNWKHYLENKLPICNSRNVQKGKSSMLDTCRKPLLEVCDLLDSKRVPVTSNKRIHGPYPYYGANGIQDYVNDYIFDDDLVLLAEDGGNFGSKDKPIAYRVSGKCWVNNHAHVLKPREGLNVDYLCYSLMYYDTKGLVNGATRQKLTQAAMKNIKIPILAYNEQLKIVKRIAMVSTLINNRKKELSLLDKLVKSRFLERFGDPIINPFDYPIHELGDYIENLTSGSRGWARYYADDGNAWFITIKNVKNCKITVDNMQTINAPDNAEAKRTRVKEGDLLISITADLGRTGVVTKEIANKGSYINQHLSCIRLNRHALEPLYVAYFMESEAGKRQFKKENQSAVKAGINFKSIQSLKLMVPPLVRQEEFLSFYKQVDKSKMAVQRSLDELETLKKSLMQTYFG